mgnify:CR=1 FL=1
MQKECVRIDVDCPARKLLVFDGVYCYVCEMEGKCRK